MPRRASIARARPSRYGAADGFGAREIARDSGHLCSGTAEMTTFRRDGPRATVKRGHLGDRTIARDRPSRDGERGRFRRASAREGRLSLRGTGPDETVFALFRAFCYNRL